MLAINRSEIENSMKVLYGDKFNSQRYLRRFIDIDFRLFDPSRIGFIDALISKVNLADYLNQTQDREVGQELGTSISLLQNFFSTSDTSLRMIEQAFFRFGLLYNSLRSDRRSFVLGASVALILRTIDPGGYHRFISGNITDNDVYENIITPLFNRAGREFFRLRRDSRSGEGTLFKATIVLASMTRETDGSPTRGMEDSPLWHKYQELAAMEPEDPADRSTYMSESKLAQDVLNTMNRNIDRAYRIIDFGFWHSVKRLELISPDLIKGT